ncbi:unnamed protein product [Enterobius vermicularis]|uniref:Protein SPT2 homolog n=1 Tax=Enterobius vermicularis TaxID=51028 RepID=A0A0N4VB96_ENTVE|nr:unnamed protein product [Enterobius vermicularis]
MAIHRLYNVCLMLCLFYGIHGQRMLSLQDIVALNNLFQSPSIARFGLLGAPLRVATPSGKTEKLSGLPPLPDEDGNSSKEKTLVTKVEAKLPKKPKPLPVPPLPILFGLPNIDQRPELPPQHESKYNGQFAPDGSFIGTPAKIEVEPASTSFEADEKSSKQDTKFKKSGIMQFLETKVQDDANSQEEEEQFMRKTRSESNFFKQRSQRSGDQKASPAAKPNVFVDDAKINDDIHDGEFTKRNNTKNDREFRKRFMKYARVEDDADLVQTSEEDGDDNLSSEEDDFKISGRTDSKRRYGTARQRIDTTKNKRIKLISCATDGLKGNCRKLSALALRSQSGNEMVASRNDALINSDTGKRIYLQRQKPPPVKSGVAARLLPKQRTIPPKKADEVTVSPKSGRVNPPKQVQLRPPKTPGPLKTVVEQPTVLKQPVVSLIPQFPRDPQDAMFLKEVEDYDRLLDAEGNTGPENNGPPPQLQVIIPTTTLPPLQNVPQKLVPLPQPTDTPLSQQSFLRFPEFVTPSPFIIPHQVPQYTQPPNLFGNFFPLHPWQFSQGVPQLPSTVKDSPQPLNYASAADGTAFSSQVILNSDPFYLVVYFIDSYLFINYASKVKSAYGE